MTPCPKPERRRGPKPRVRIARRSVPKRGGQIARRTRVRKQKVGKVAEMRREATRLMSRIVLAGNGGFCVALERKDDGVGYCGDRATDCAHVLAKKSWPSVRFDLGNAVGLCRRHHEELRSARLAGPSKMRRLYKMLYGRGAWEHLLTRASGRAPGMGETLESLRAVAAVYGIK